MISLAIVIGSAGGRFPFIQQYCSQIDLFKSLRNFMVFSLFNPTFIRTTGVSFRLPEHRGDYPFCSNSDPSVVQAREPGWFDSLFS
jgi:hypothetical protein